MKLHLEPRCVRVAANRVTGWKQPSGVTVSVVRLRKTLESDSAFPPLQGHVEKNAVGFEAGWQRTWQMTRQPWDAQASEGVRTLPGSIAYVHAKSSGGQQEFGGSLSLSPSLCDLVVLAWSFLQLSGVTGLSVRNGLDI